MFEYNGKKTSIRLIISCGVKVQSNEDFVVFISDEFINSRFKELNFERKVMYLMEENQFRWKVFPHMVIFFAREEGEARCCDL